MCVDLQHGSQKTKVVATGSSVPPSRSVTPLPTDTPVGSAATSGFDVIPGEASERSPTTINFLTQPWAATLSQSHHFQFTFLPRHPVGSLVDRQCMTVRPSDFSLVKETITVMFSDKNANNHIDTVLCRNLTRFTPKKSQVFVVVLRGPRMGQVCNLKKVYRAKQMYSLKPEQGEEFEESWLNCCAVQPHEDGKCPCAKYLRK